MWWIFSSWLANNRSKAINLPSCNLAMFKYSSVPIFGGLAKAWCGLFAWTRNLSEANKTHFLTLRRPSCTGAVGRFCQMSWNWNWKQTQFTFLYPWTVLLREFCPAFKDRLLPIPWMATTMQPSNFICGSSFVKCYCTVKKIWIVQSTLTTLSSVWRKC